MAGFGSEGFASRGIEPREQEESGEEDEVGEVDHGKVLRWSQHPPARRDPKSKNGSDPLKKRKEEGRPSFFVLRSSFFVLRSSFFVRGPWSLVRITDH